MSAQVKQVRLPHNYKARDYQLPVFDIINRGIKRIVLICHRRWGKEKTCINIMAKAMFQRVGTYYYFFPTYKQGKRILWDGMDKDGFRFLDHFPKELVKGSNETELKVDFINGSTFQIIGTDKIDSIVGANPVGCVFSEYSLQDPAAWDFIRPILAENGGWAIFNFTPRGENHAFELYQYALSDPDEWGVVLQTVEDTKAISKEVLEQERKEILIKDGNDALYQQEYMCSFTAPIPGAYYATQLIRAQEQNRITLVPHDPAVPVDTIWDLGINDSMSIGFVQIVGREIHWIDYLESSGEGLPYYIAELQKKPYIYGEHYAPHDIEVRELSTGKSRKETAQQLGINFRVAPKLGISDGIHAVRMLFDYFWFDNKLTHRLLNALKSYHKEYDEKNKVYKDHPEHDWSSHASDMVRTFAVSFNKNRMNGVKRVSPFMNKLQKPEKNSLEYANTRKPRLNVEVVS